MSLVPRWRLWQTIEAARQSWRFTVNGRDPAALQDALEELERVLASLPDSSEFQSFDRRWLRGRRGRSS